MNKLEIPYINISATKDTASLDALLDNVAHLPISCIPWPEYASETKADFSIAHDNDSILLRYKITEKYLTANAVDNGAIHKDSCVEFFISFDHDPAYYNLEFNCLGFTKIGYGLSRNNRELLPLEVIKKLSFSSKINSNLNKEMDGFDWEILLIIPKEIFVHHQIQSFHNLTAKGNFYKCGDGLPEPHFLSWNMIEAKEPDFHKSEYFGMLEFQ